MNFIKSDAGVKCLSVIALLTAFLVPVTFADDSPQFRGPNRDGCSNEKNLLKIWPEAGPNLLWSTEGLGTGWSSPAIADGLLFATGMDKEKMAYDIQM